MDSSFNPHWIGDECCRDYRIGSAIVKDVPDKFVLRMTKFRGGYGFAAGNVEEFVSRANIETSHECAKYTGMRS